jgi:hypothetical protein
LQSKSNFNILIKLFSDDVPEIEEEKINPQSMPETFGNKLISLQELEKNSGTFQLPNEFNNIKNITLLTSSVKPIDQVIEPNEEWNYDILHTEIGQIVRSQYGEFYQK